MEAGGERRCSTKKTLWARVHLKVAEDQLVCESKRACVCITYQEPQQKSEPQSGNWRKLAIEEEWLAATFVVIVFLLRVVP